MIVLVMRVQRTYVMTGVIIRHLMVLTLNPNVKFEMHSSKP